MKANTIDDLEERLRAACHAAIPRLLDNDDDVRQADTSDADSPPLQLRMSPTTNDRLPALRRTRFVSGIAAAVLLAAAAAAIATHDQPATDLSSPDSLDTQTSTLPTSVGDEWVQAQGPPLEARWQNLSIGTGTGWFIWGGMEALAANQTGLDDGSYLDVATGEWRLLPPAPIPASTQVDFGLWTGAEVVVVQGGDAVHMAAFDPTSFTWRAIPIPADTLAGWPRGDGGFNRGESSFVDGRVVIFFPNDPERGLAPQVLLYDPSNDTFEVGATPPSSMTSLTGPITSSDSQLFVVGGGQHNTDSSCLPAWSLYTYDVPNNVWTSFGIIRGNWLPATAAWIDGRVVLAGGTECTTNKPVRMTMTFDPTTPSMSTRAEMPIDLPEVRGPAVTLEHEVAIVTPSGQLLTYEPAHDRWQIGPSFLPIGVLSGDTRMVALGTGQLAVWSAGIILGEGGGISSCCYPTGEAFTYTPSKDNQQPVIEDSATEPLGGLVTTSSTLSQPESQTTSPALSGSPPLIPVGSVVCLVAGASQRVAPLCADELGGAVINARSISDESFVMPVDPTNASHVAATTRAGELLGVPVHALDANLVPSGRAASPDETTYLVLGVGDRPYAP